MTLSAQYARAIYDTQKETSMNASVFIERVVEALKRRHHEKLLPTILEEYKKLELQEGKRVLTLRIASEHEKKNAVAKLKELSIDEAHPRVVIDPTLVKGFVIEGGDFRYDASVKRTLLDLYTHLVTT